MCAIDALGIAPLLDRPIEIVPHDPLTAAEIWVRVDPGEGSWWEPRGTVVLAGAARCEGPSFRTCCDVLNFFQSSESAVRYLNTHPEITGRAVSVPEAIDVGCAVFGDILEEV